MGKHLTFEQRCRIEVLHGAGSTQAEITVSVGTSQSAVSRELARNHGQRGYRCKQAQQKAEARCSSASAVPRKMSQAMIAAIEGKLCIEQLSPQQISGWLTTTQSASVSHGRIYLHIWAEKRAGGVLFKQLRRRRCGVGRDTTGSLAIWNRWIIGRHLSRSMRETSVFQSSVRMFVLCDLERDPPGVIKCSHRRPPSVSSACWCMDGSS